MYLRKRKDSWRVEIDKAGQRLSASFDTKAEARAWGTRQEAEILAGKRSEVPNKTLKDLLERYRDEVSVTKRGERWEKLRLDLIARDDIGAVKLKDLAAPDFAAWRDRRLRKVSQASVRREWTLLSAALNVSVREWHWLKENPLKAVKRPPAPPPRERIPTDHEIERLCFALGYGLDTITARVALAMLFSIETGMRAGEIAGLTWDRVDLVRRVAKLERTKNGTAREVPLSGRAVELLQELGGDGSVFGLTVQQIDVLFRKAKDRALIKELHFHDMRALAVTRLSKRLDILSLAKMIGHRDLKTLQVYYRPDAADMAKLLD